MASSVVFTYVGMTNPMKRANPTTKMFLDEFRSTYWRLERPTAAITPRYIKYNYDNT